MGEGFDETALRQAIAAAHPDLIGVPLRPFAVGWDSVAYDLGGRLIIKRPKRAAAEAGLRREAAFLALVRPRVYLPVPDLHLVEGPLLSWHVALPGERLETAGYDALAEADKDRLAQTLAQFYGELHRVEVPFAPQVEAWSSAEDILAHALQLLPDALQGTAHVLMARYAALPPDPLGVVFGQFDGHGWNMAFDHAAGRLNGIYDFGDAGIGARHREFIYAGLTSLDLMARVVAFYAAETGLALEMGRVAVLAGAHRLWELSVGGVENRAGLVQRFGEWVDWRTAG